MTELGRTEEVIREMDKLANKNHIHIATEEELNVYRNNWWIRSNFDSDTMPMRHRADFKKRCHSFVVSRIKKIKLVTKIGGKALPRLGGTGKIPVDSPHLRHHRDDGPSTDGSGKLAKNSVWSIYLWNESHNEFGAKVTVAKFGNSQRSLLSPTGGVKSIPPTTENWLRKQYKYSKKIYKSTEDKHETNHINNKYNDMNMNTHKMHNI